MNNSPSYRLEQVEKEKKRAIITDFHLMKSEMQRVIGLQHDLIADYHQHIVKLIEHLQHDKDERQQQIEQLKSDVFNHLQDNETLKVGSK